MLLSPGTFPWCLLCFATDPVLNALFSFKPTVTHMAGAIIIAFKSENTDRECKWFVQMHTTSQWTSLVAQTIKRLPTMSEIRVQSLGQEDPLEKEMATHSSILAWKIPWTEEPGRLQSMGSLRVGHDWAISLSLFTFMHWRRKWQPTPVFLPGESQGRGSLVGCRVWGRTESDTTEVT